MNPQALLEKFVSEWSAFEEDDPINGADLVDYVSEFYRDAKAAIAQPRPRSECRKLQHDLDRARCMLIGARIAYSTAPAWVRWIVRRFAPAMVQP